MRSDNTPATDVCTRCHGIGWDVVACPCNPDGDSPPNPVQQLAAARAEAEQMKEQVKNRDDELHEHEKATLETIMQRDAREEQIEKIYAALGGTGEWCAKIPPDDPPNSGDLGDDAVALAEILAAELTRLREREQLLTKAFMRNAACDYGRYIPTSRGEGRGWCIIEFTGSGERLTQRQLDGVYESPIEVLEAVEKLEQHEASLRKEP